MCEYCRGEKELFKKENDVVGVNIFDISRIDSIEKETDYLKIERRNNGNFLRLASEFEQCIDSPAPYIEINFCPICGQKLKEEK